MNTTIFLEGASKGALWYAIIKTYLIYRALILHKKRQKMNTTILPKRVKYY